MKKTYFGFSFVFLSLLLSTQVNAQTGDVFVQSETQPGYELLSAFTDKQTANKLLSKTINTDLSIRASSLIIDLASEQEVEFAANSSWANEFVWKFGDGSSLSGFRNVSHKFSKPGKYQVEVIASNKDEISRKTIEIEVVDQSAPLELEEMEHYIVFPHDNKLEVDVRLNLPRREKKLHFEVQDVQGNQVYQFEVGRVRRKQLIHIDLQNLESGKYYTVLKGKRFSMVSRLTVAR